MIRSSKSWFTRIFFTKETDRQVGFPFKRCRNLKERVQLCPLKSFFIFYYKTNLPASSYVFPGPICCKIWCNRDTCFLHKSLDFQRQLLSNDLMKFEKRFCSDQKKKIVCFSFSHLPFLGSI